MLSRVLADASLNSSTDNHDTTGRGGDQPPNATADRHRDTAVLGDLHPDNQHDHDDHDRSRHDSLHFMAIFDRVPPRP